MRLIVFLLTITLASNTLLLAKENLKFGVFSYSSKSVVLQQYKPVIDYLNAHLINAKLELVILNREEFDTELQRNTLDILTTNPSHFEVIRNNNMFIRTIATTRKFQKGIATDSFGGVIFTRASNNAINTIYDLKSSSIASMDVKSLGAYQAQVLELFEKGIKLTKNLTVMKNQHDILRSVMEGKHEVGFIRTGIIESQISMGKLNVDDIKIINSQNMPHYPYILSTRLYPEWPVAILPNMKDSTANALTILLLRYMLQPDNNSSISGFTLPQNYASVEHLIQTLGLPPYDVKDEVNLSQIYAQYKTEAFIVLVFIIVLIIVVLIIINLNLRIRSSEERFLLAMEGTQDGLFDWNMIDNSMFHSKQFETTLGYDGTELPQTINAWKDLVHPDDIDDAYKKIDDHLKIKGSEPYVNVFRMKHKDGSWRWMEGRGKVRFNSKGMPTRFIGFNKDVTDNIEREKQLLVQTKYAQMGEMIGMIAHQWRQPLSAIAASASSLLVKQVINEMDEKSLEKGLNDIVGLTEHLSRTINDFRDFFKNEKKKTDVRLEDLVKGSIQIIDSIFIAKNITLNTEYLCDEKITTYANEVKQVILNILKNAQEIIEEKNISKPIISIKTYLENEKYCISIEDNAGGISTAIIDKIFEPYYTTKSSLNGTGLGLYMSKTIIEEHCKGSLEARNVNEGAMFIISMNRSVD